MNTITTTTTTPTTTAAARSAAALKAHQTRGKDGAVRAAYRAHVTRRVIEVLQAETKPEQLVAEEKLITQEVHLEGFEFAVALAA